MPSASATTCDVAAVPRNWQPPPGVPHARHPISAACSSVMRPCAKRAPIDCTLPASSAPSAGSVTPPGTIDARQVAAPGEREHRRGQSLVARGDAEHAGPPGQRADQPPHRDRGVVAIRQAVEHARRALRSAVARIAAERRERQHAGLAQRARRLVHEQPDLPVPGVIAEGDRRAVRVCAARRACSARASAADSTSRGIPSHPGILGHAEQVAAGLVQQHLLRQRKGSLGPARLGSRAPQQRAPPNGSRRGVWERRGSRTGASWGCG